LGSKESILAGQTEKTNKQTNKALASEREKNVGIFFKQPAVEATKIDQTAIQNRS